MALEARKTMLLTAAAAAAAMGIACSEPPAPVAPPPPEVYVAPVVQKDVPEYLDLVGQTQGFQDVEVRARVEGYIETVNFREGSFVRRGDLLYTIDRKPLEASLAAAKADVAEARARLEKATNDVNRYTPLVARKAVSQQELDNALAARDAARSQVDAATANVDKSTLDLGYTRITSPIDGLIGTTVLKAGNFVGRGEATLLTTISQMNPIILRVAVTEADYLRVIKRNPDAAGREPQQDNIELTLADGQPYAEKGKIGPVERAVDASTGTLGMQVIYPNPQNVLRPGQYGRARVLVDMKAGALLVPQRAVQELQNLYNVTVVGADNKLVTKTVTVGPRVGSQWMIESGLDPSDRVVVEGASRLRPGTLVASKEAPASPAATSGTVEPLPPAPQK